MFVIFFYQYKLLLSLFYSRMLAFFISRSDADAIRTIESSGSFRTVSSEPLFSNGSSDIEVEQFFEGIDKLLEGSDGEKEDAYHLLEDKKPLVRLFIQNQSHQMYFFSLTLPTLRLFLSKTEGHRYFWKPSKPCHECGYSLDSSPMCQGFSHLLGFLHYSVLDKLATSSMRVENSKSWRNIERFCYIYYCINHFKSANALKPCSISLAEWNLFHEIYFGASNEA